MPAIRHAKGSFDVEPSGWEFLPFRFERIGHDQVLLTNLVGEFDTLSAVEFDRFSRKQLDDQSLLRRLRGRHIIRRNDESLPLELLAMKVKTRYRRLAELTSLHIFVVTLRCEHACGYCQVS